MGAPRALVTKGPSTNVDALNSTPTDSKGRNVRALRGRGLRRALRAAGFAGITASMLAVYAVRDAITAEAERAPVRDRWTRRWSRALLGLFSIEVARIGASPDGPAGRGRLIVANHRSTIDVGILLSTFGGHMVSRADLSGWPLVGAAARKTGTIFVERGDASSGASAIREIRQALRAGETVCIFPEGTTFEGDEVRPFHPGAFVAAQRTGALVVPVGIAYARGSEAAFVNETFLAHLSRMAAARAPTRVVMAIGEPIATAERAKETRDRAQKAVERLVREARSRAA
jgi:1-acyl-sn-glycerol-3-phosphate acyltransferase